MRQAVQDIWQTFTERFEGYPHDERGAWLYLDVLGLVTIGYGNLVNSPGAARALPLRREDGSLATEDEITIAWTRVRMSQGFKLLGGGHRVWRELSTLRLDEAGVRELLYGKLATNDAALHRRYADFAAWPADAQLAVHSLAWACGNAYRYPKMDAYLAVGDFESAAEEIEMTREANPGNHLSDRNRANRICMRNAARVRDMHLDPDELIYPRDLSAEQQDEIPTDPELPNAASEPTIYVKKEG